MSEAKWRKPMKGDDFVEESLVFPYYASVKLDGYRAINEGGLLLTSSGKPVTNEFTQELFQRDDFEGLDGELIVGPWNDPRAFHNTSGPVRKAREEPDVRWFLFDDRTTPGRSFDERFQSVKRRVSLEHSCHKPSSKARIEVIPQTIVRDRAELSRFEFSAIAGGFEGVMLRKPEGHYKFGRSTVNENLLLKVKRFVTEEARVVGFEEQLRTVTQADVEGGKNAPNEVGTMVRTGMIGAFKVWSKPWGDFDIQATSLSHEERKHAFDNFTAEFFGEIASFEYFPHGSIDRPRHGIFRAIRGREDITE